MSNSISWFYHFLIIGVFLSINIDVFADNDTKKEFGNIQVHADPKITYLLNAEANYMKENPVMSGYRIQIIEAPRRDEVFKKQGEVLRIFPEIKCYVVYQQPSFKLRIGDYYDRLDALRMLNKIQKHFPTAFLIREDVQIHEPKKSFND